MSSLPTGTKLTIGEYGSLVSNDSSFDRVGPIISLETILSSE